MTVQLETDFVYIKNCRYHHTGFVYKTDIADYYASIPHAQLYAEVRALWKHPPRWVNLIYAAIKAGLYKDGHHYDAQAQGILKGSPLSYVLGSFYLHLVDKAFQNNPAVSYIRYMDDIIIFTHTRSALRRVVKRCQMLFEQLKLKVSKAKTTIGKTSKGFSFLGYRFEPNRKVTVRPETVSKSLERVDRLLEQGRLTKERLEKHVKGFITWARGGLSGLVDAEQTRETFVDALLTAGVSRRLAPPIKHTYDKGEKVWLKRSVKLSRWHAWL